ncbi:hypothetical protein N9Q27_00535 [bacterium]|nr:hypothetical protein [bacterium]
MEPLDGDIIVIDTLDLTDLTMIPDTTSVWDKSIIANCVSPIAISDPNEPTAIFVTADSGVEYDVGNVVEDLVDKVEILFEELTRRGIDVDMDRRLDEKRMIKKLSGNRE